MPDPGFLYGMADPAASDPNASSSDVINGIPFLPATGDFEPSTYDPGNVLTPPTTGGASVNTPAQSAGTGAGILGWLGLANNVANTVSNATRQGYTTRPGVYRSSSSLGSFGTVTTTTLLVIVAVFVGVLFLLRK